MNDGFQTKSIILGIGISVVLMFAVIGVKDTFFKTMTTEAAATPDVNAVLPQSQNQSATNLQANPGAASNLQGMPSMGAGSGLGGLGGGSGILGLLGGMGGAGGSSNFMQQLMQQRMMGGKSGLGAAGGLGGLGALGALGGAGGNLGGLGGLASLFGGGGSSAALAQLLPPGICGNTVPLNATGTPTSTSPGSLSYPNIMGNILH